MEITKRNLVYKFTSLELKEIARTMAYQVGEMEGVEQEKKDTAARFKERIDALSTRIKDAARKINRGQEERLVDCKVDYDYVHNVVRLVRLDTMELVEERAMTAVERQQMLDLPTFRDTEGPEDESATAH